MSEPLFKNYDPESIQLTFKGVSLTGVMDGTFVTAERSSDGFMKEIGAKGSVVRVRNQDTSGSIKVTLQASSPTNDFLSAIALSDEALGDGTGSFLIRDSRGTTLLHAGTAWIKKYPTVEYADKGTSREWEFECADLFIENIGGSLV